MIGIPSVEGHAGQTIAIRWWIILCMGLRWMIMNHYSGLGPWQWYHPLEAIPDGVNFCMVGDTSQYGDTRCWGSCRVIHQCPVVQHTLYVWVMGDITPCQRSWAMAMVPYTQSCPEWCRFLHCQRRKSRWGFLVLRVMQCKPSLSEDEEYFVWVPDRLCNIIMGHGNDTTHPKPTVMKQFFAW